MAVPIPVAWKLPFGLGIELAALGALLTGQTVSLSTLPSDPAQYISLVGVGFILLAAWFMIRPPRWVLPAWYREFTDLRKTVPNTYLMAADQIRSDLESIGADLTEAMTQTKALREGRSHDAAWSAIDAAARAERAATALTGRIEDDALFALVASWKRTFDATPKGGPTDLLTGAPGGASDAEWQLLVDASDDALAHIRTVADAMGQMTPRI